MSTSFITLVPPPGISQEEAGDLLEQASTSDVPSTAPNPFIDALIVRKRVFVDEQHCRLSTEIDEDDSRSYHWLVHASIGPGSNKSTTATTSSSPSAATHLHDAFARRKSVGGQVPVGTMRLTPPPHGPHPAPGSVDCEGGEDVSALRVKGGDRPTRFHDGTEAYVKLGRLATVKEFRGLGLGRLVVNEALSWVAQNAAKVQALPDDPIEREKVRREGREWKGLVLAHAQLSAVSFYEAVGFEVDRELGEWMEEGIEHVAVWKRIDVRG